MHARRFSIINWAQSGDQNGTNEGEFARQKFHLLELFAPVEQVSSASEITTENLLKIHQKLNKAFNHLWFTKLNEECNLRIIIRIEIIIERLISMKPEQALEPFAADFYSYKNLGKFKEIEAEVEARLLPRIKPILDNIFSSCTSPSEWNSFNDTQTCEYYLAVCQQHPELIDVDFIMKFIKAKLWVHRNEKHPFEKFLEQLPVVIWPTIMQQIFNDREHISFLYQNRLLVIFLKFYKKHVQANFAADVSKLHMIAEILPISDFLKFPENTFRELLLLGFDYNIVLDKIIINLKDHSEEASLIYYEAVATGIKPIIEKLKGAFTKFQVSNTEKSETVMAGTAGMVKKLNEVRAETFFDTKISYNMLAFLKYLVEKKNASKAELPYFLKFPQDFIQLAVESKIVTNKIEFEKVFYKEFELEKPSVDNSDKLIELENANSQLASRVLNLETQLAVLTQQLQLLFPEFQRLKAAEEVKNNTELKPHRK